MAFVPTNSEPKAPIKTSKSIQQEHHIQETYLLEILLFSNVVTSLLILIQKIHLTKIYNEFIFTLSKLSSFHSALILNSHQKKNLNENEISFLSSNTSSPHFLNHLHTYASIFFGIQYWNHSQNHHSLTILNYNHDEIIYDHGLFHGVDVDVTRILGSTQVGVLEVVEE